MRTAEADDFSKDKPEYLRMVLQDTVRISAIAFWAAR